MSPPQLSQDTFLTTAAPFVEGRPAIRTLGLVFGEVVQGANVFRDIAANFRDCFGGRSKTTEREFLKMRTAAMEEMKQKARGLGANAVVGFHFGFSPIGPNNQMYVCQVFGTAVLIPQ